MAIQMHYRKLDNDRSLPWSVYGEANILTKDMKKFAREVNKDAHYWTETRVVDTRKNPELKL